MEPPVLARAGLITLLGGRRAFARALRDQSWQRLLRGTYAPADAVPDLALRCRAAQLLCPDGARVADRCLLWILGVDVLPPGPPLLELVVPRDVVPPRRAGVRARAADLPARDRVTLQPYGLRCVRPSRAAVDCMRLLTLPEAVVVADAVQQARRCDLQQLGDELLRHAGAKGVRQARRALELSDARAESPPESRLRLALVQAGLRPVPQHEVWSGGRLLARVDLAFPEARLAIEYDGRAVHERTDVFARDRQRQNDLVAAGWTVLRFTTDDLRWGAAAAVAQILSALSRVAA